MRQRRFGVWYIAPVRMLLAEPTVSDPEVLDLLREIRDLLLPVSDAYDDAYQRRELERLQARIEAIRRLLSTDKRRAAWDLADGSRNQADIVRRSGLAKGSTSVLFKELRELGAVSSDEKPTRLVEGV